MINKEREVILDRLKNLKSSARSLGEYDEMSTEDKHLYTRLLDKIEFLEGILEEAKTEETKKLYELGEKFMIGDMEAMLVNVGDFKMAAIIIGGGDNNRNGVRVSELINSHAGYYKVSKSELQEKLLDGYKL